MVHSATDLFKYKSFFLLIFALILLDRVIKKYVHIDRSSMDLAQLGELSAASADYLFNQVPGLLWVLLTDYRTFLILSGLFFLKQIISLWPSSDMRRMHRKERGMFGLLSSLVGIRWQQVVWDAIAVGTICGLYAIWATLGFIVTRTGWNAHPHGIWIVLFLLCMGLFLPLGMAGFSYSSKLAVLSRGNFREKLGLFYRLFTTGRVLWPSWIFFSCRIALESIFVLIIPIAVLLFVDSFWVRIMVATLLATPVYSYLKMASFKFFLEIYQPYDLVQQEYHTYYADNPE